MQDVFDRDRQVRREARGGRRTDSRLEDFERILICTACDRACSVFEAATGASTEEEHRFTDPGSFVCVECLDPPEIEL